MRERCRIEGETVSKVVRERGREDERGAGQLVRWKAGLSSLFNIKEARSKYWQRIRQPLIASRRRSFKRYSTVEASLIPTVYTIDKSIILLIHCTSQKERDGSVNGAKKCLSKRIKEQMISKWSSFQIYLLHI